MQKKMISVEEFGRKNAARRDARSEDVAERRPAIVAGLKKMAKRFDAAGDEETGAALAQAATQAEGLLATYYEQHHIAEAQRPDHIGVAVASAAAELRKQLPGCFGTDKDAEVFAQGLPLIEARAAARAGGDTAAKAGKRAGEALRQFVDLVERLATVATGAKNTAAGLDRLADIGR